MGYRGVKIERSRKFSTSKSGVKSSASNRNMLEQEKLALEMAEKVSLNTF